MGLFIDFGDISYAITDTHCFAEDDDVKHRSKIATRYYKVRWINWWPTPP